MWKDAIFFGIQRLVYTAWKVSKYGVFSGPCFPVFSPNAGKYGPEKTPCLDTFHAVLCLLVFNKWSWSETHVYDLPMNKMDVNTKVWDFRAVAKLRFLEEETS